MQIKMLRRLWLAVVLGVLLGFGIAVVPSSINSAKRVSPMQLTSGMQYQFEASASPSLQLQLILVALFAGLAIAVPIFLLAKRRS
jgi:hypothetical protein